MATHPGQTLALAGISAVLVVGLLFTAWPSPVVTTAAQRNQADQQPMITVSGEGEVRAEPDMAVATVGVTHVAPTAQEAMDEVSRRLTAVIAAARALGIQDRDVQTSGLSLQPIFRPRPRGDEQPQEIEAYRASNNVSLTVRDLRRASSVLDAAAQNGANVIGGLRFGLSNVDELRTRALANAVANAEAKANAIAAAAGVPITSVLSIAEESVSVPRPAAQADFAAAPLGAVREAPPVEPGEMVVRVRIRASYGI